MKAAALCASGLPACLSALLRIGVHLAFWLLANELAGPAAACLPSYLGPTRGESPKLLSAVACFVYRDMDANH